MAERVSSDHPSVETVRATVERAGGTRRPEVRLPEGELDERPGGVVRLVVDDREYHAPVEGGTIHGAFDNARLARERTGTNHLAEWIRDRGIDFGRSVLVDVVVPGERYGARLPGEEAVYAAVDPPSRSLRDIAERLDGG